MTMNKTCKCGADAWELVGNIVEKDNADKLYQCVNCGASHFEPMTDNELAEYNHESYIDSHEHDYKGD